MSDWHWKTWFPVVVVAFGMGVFMAEGVERDASVPPIPEPVFDSGLVSVERAGHAVEVDVALAGAREIFLVVSDAGDGIACDLADWAEPRFVGGGEEVLLTDLPMVEAHTGYGEILVGRNAEGSPLVIDGNPVEFGVGAHALSIICYAVPEGMERFRARAGLDTQGTEEGCGSTVRFRVFTRKPFHLYEEVYAKATPKPFYRSRTAEELTMPPGFEGEAIYRVAPDQGSWVSMTCDERGRLIVSGQFGGLYRLELESDGKVSGVESLNLELRGAQGLLYYEQSLYVVVNGGKQSGLYRAEDRDGDDRFETVTRLRRFEGEGEHGPHAVVAGPRDGRLYVVAGNATRLPHPEASTLPRRWQPEEVLPHIGQTDGYWSETSPGGWICRTDPESGEFEVVAVGLRNPYDIAFDAEGELFTFDADMEWDMGLPWYRPTRINHVISGSEFGWRTGSAKWPDWYLDSVGSVYDVGASSPTGMVFGYDSRFPEPYRQALFLGDWSFGKIYALHLRPQGSTFTGELETFVSGAPLPATDLVIRPQDGALYFLVGGRNTSSALYRVEYTGGGESAKAEYSASERGEGAQWREIRHRLEAFHHEGEHPEAVETAWPYLAHPDRYIRYAARVAIEHQPTSTWESRIWEENRPRAVIASAAALARCGAERWQPRLIRKLTELEWTALDGDERLDLLRAFALTFTRLGDPGPDSRNRILEYLNSKFPSSNPELDRELGQLLIALRAPGIVARALEAVDSAATQEEQIFYICCLRTLPRRDWNLDRLRNYFEWFNRILERGGGVSFGDYLELIKSEVVERLTDADRAVLAPILEAHTAPDPYAGLYGRRLIREWSVDEILAAAQNGLENGDLERGREVFSAALCLKCHRFRGRGGMTGPDLTGVGRRYDLRMLVESVLEPSRVISDQYNTVDIVTRNGEVHTGRIGDINEEVLFLMVDLINPAALETIPHEKIESIKPSPVSMMPAGLLNFFTQEEILDLLAFLSR